MKFIITQKAAMFGLDARIALAIFGALSVISGAALYSAIKSAKTEQWRQSFEEITKASDAYYLDTGKQVPYYATSTAQSYYLSHLAVNYENLTRWNGPYLNVTYADIGSSIKNSMTAQIHPNSTLLILLRITSEWSAMNNINSDGFCTIGSSDCSEWITLYSGHSDASSKLLNIFNDLDNLVDGGDGALSGKVRYNTAGSGYIMYRGTPHKRTV
jgi:type II secretory pathway pseudopilin PulG